MKSIIHRELINLLAGFLATLILLCILYFWRLINTSWFLFLQIASSSTVLYLLLLSVSNRIKLFYGRELIAIVLAFTVVTTLLVNIDRSRSFYLLKWVDQYSFNNSTSLNVIVAGKRFDKVQEMALRQRVKEQGQSATISIDGEKIKLTFFGKTLVRISNLLARVFRLYGYINA